MIPLPVLPPIPWRLVGAVALVVVVALAGWRVTAWRAGYLEAEELRDALERTEKALASRTAEAEQCAARERVSQQAWQDAAAAAESKAAQDRNTARRIENELSTRLADADRRGRELARRLSDAAARACPGAVPAAAPAPGVAHDPAGEPAGAGAVGEATAALIGACDRDAARLEGWQRWWAGVSGSKIGP